MKQENGRYAAGFLFAVATFVVMAIWLCTQYTPQRLWELFCSVRLRCLVGAAELMVVYWVLESTELHLALKRFSPQQAPCDTFRATMIGQFFNCITPFASGGQPMQALYLMKKGVALSFASCSLLIKFIVYQFVLTLYSAVTLALCFRQFAGRVPLVGWLAAAGFGINLLVIVGLLCLGFLRRPTERFLYGILSLLRRMQLIKEQTAQRAAERMQKELEEFYQGFAQIRSDWWGILQMSLLTAVQLTAFFLVPLCIFYAFGMGRADVLLMVCAGAFVLNFTSFIPLPGAAAGAEIGFHTVFGLFFPASVLSLAILLWRLFTFYLPILVGGVFTMTAGVWGRGKKKISA